MAPKELEALHDAQRAMCATCRHCSIRKDSEGGFYMVCCGKASLCAGYEQVKSEATQKITENSELPFESSSGNKDQDVL